MGQNVLLAKHSYTMQSTLLQPCETLKRCEFIQKCHHQKLHKMQFYALPRKKNNKSPIMQQFKKIMLI